MTEYPTANPQADVLRDGKTLYVMDEEGSIEFRPGRKIGDVRIPNHVYDLWLPILGLDGLGVYALYCRLERSGTVRGLNLEKIARYCRIGNNTMVGINAMLESYGFVTIQRPEGVDRLTHRPLVLQVHDAPEFVPAEIIQIHFPDGKYKPLVAWLVDHESPLPSSQAGGPELLDSNSGVTRQEGDSVRTDSLPESEIAALALAARAPAGTHARAHEDNRAGERERAPRSAAVSGAGQAHLAGPGATAIPPGASESEPRFARDSRRPPAEPDPRPQPGLNPTWHKAVVRYLGGEPDAGEFREAMRLQKEYAALSPADLGAVVESARAAAREKAGQDPPVGMTWLTRELRKHQNGGAASPPPVEPAAAPRPKKTAAEAEAEYLRQRKIDKAAHDRWMEEIRSGKRP